MRLLAALSCFFLSLSACAPERSGELTSAELGNYFPNGPEGGRASNEGYVSSVRTLSDSGNDIGVAISSIGGRSVRGDQCDDPAAPYPEGQAGPQGMSCEVRRGGRVQPEWDQCRGCYH